MLYLEKAMFATLDGTIQGLRCALQSAIALEHSTIPPYLYALYSIKQGMNQEIALLVSSIVTEEMLHMALGCNLLNAIGGAPQLDGRAFIPSYPCHLPGSVQDQLIVGLEPMAIDLLERVFMEIEEPENPLCFPDRKHGELLDSKPTTIGQFYARISDQMQALAMEREIFVGDPARQLVNWGPSRDEIAIFDLEAALRAIRMIVEQGEGTTASPLDRANEMAHYYRFSEIVHGHKLIEIHGWPGYAYRGDEIGFDPKGVWSTIANPAELGYAKGTRAWNLNNTFNYTYTNLLKSLHSVFNGAPDNLRSAIALMESLKTQAMDLMSIQLSSGLYAGPSFEYLPVL